MMTTNILREGERLDDLQRGGLKLIQRPDKFCFGMDAVLLSAFTVVKENDTVLDMCSGNGVIPVLLAGRTKGKQFVGLEIQEEVVEMAGRSIEYNQLQHKVSMHKGDVKEASSILGAASFDVVTCNPPYMVGNHGLKNRDESKMLARHEILCNLNDVIREAAQVTKPGGHFFMVHRPFRLAEILSQMVAYKLEPKRMRLVYPYIDKEPNMVLVEGVRGGNSRIQVEKPLIVYGSQGHYTAEVMELYESGD